MFHVKHEPGIDIVVCDQADPRLVGLLQIHKAFAEANTPTGSGHAIDAGEALPSSLEYVLAVEDGHALGCCGLLELTQGHGELKSLHVLESARGRGLGETLVKTILERAKVRGFERVSLETGRSEGFAASRRLYERVGFEPSEPFGAYKHDPFSYCMTSML